LLASGVIPDIAAIGGCLANNTAPVMKPITAGKEIGIEWAATGVVPICFPGIALPPNFDATAAMRVHYMANCADLSILTVGAFFGINGTDAVTGGTQAAALAAGRAERSAVLNPTYQEAAAGSVTVYLTPAAHGSNVLTLTSAWLEYQIAASSGGAMGLKDMASNADNVVDFIASFKPKY
jgi:hypothetical protein